MSLFGKGTVKGNVISVGDMGPEYVFPSGLEYPPLIICLSPF